MELLRNGHTSRYTMSFRVIMRSLRLIISLIIFFSTDKKEAILCRGENISTGWINRKRPLKENIPDYYRQEWRGDKKENFNQFGKHKRAL